MWTLGTALTLSFYPLHTASVPVRERCETSGCAWGPGGRKKLIISTTSEIEHYPQHREKMDIIFVITVVFRQFVYQVEKLVSQILTETHKVNYTIVVWCVDCERSFMDELEKIPFNVLVVSSDHGPPLSNVPYLLNKLPLTSNESVVAFISSKAVDVQGNLT